MNKPTEFFFVLFSRTSRHSTVGFKPEVMLATRESIVEDAYAEACKEGVPWANKTFGDCIRKLGDDGRLFMVFLDNHAQSFIEAAKRYGLEDEAVKLVRS